MATNNKHLLWFCKLLNTHFEGIIALAKLTKYHPARSRESIRRSRPSVGMHTAILMMNTSSWRSWIWAGRSTSGINHHIKFVIEPFSSALWIIPSALIIPVVTEKNLPTLKPLIRIGNISFELFLIHQFVIRYLSVVFNYIGFSDTIGRSVVLAVIVLATSIIATILYRRIQNQLSERILANEGISK